MLLMLYKVFLIIESVHSNVSYYALFTSGAAVFQNFKNETWCWAVIDFGFAAAIWRSRIIYSSWTPFTNFFLSSFFLFFRNKMWWKSYLDDWRHYVTKLSRPLPHRDRLRLAHTVPQGPWFTHAHTEHNDTADQWLFGPSDHAWERQSILQDHILRMWILHKSSGLYVKKQGSLC